MAELNTEHESHKLGMHTEQLSGRTQQVFFSPSADENFVYHDSIKVDFEKSTEIDAGPMEISELNTKIRDLMKKGYGTITVKNPGAKHSLGVGILNRLNLNFEGSLGYFGCGLADGPNIRISGRVGWSCAENMMSGTIVVEKNAGSTFGAAMRGGDLVCTGKNLGDSMYDGTIYVGGEIEDLGVDAVEGEMTEGEAKWLEAKLKLYGMKAPKGVKNLTKIVAGKQLWNYDNLEPSEKKLVL